MDIMANNVQSFQRLVANIEENVFFCTTCLGKFSPSESSAPCRYLLGDMVRPGSIPALDSLFASEQYSQADEAVCGPGDDAVVSVVAAAVAALLCKKIVFSCTYVVSRYFSCTFGLLSHKSKRSFNTFFFKNNSFSHSRLPRPRARAGEPDHHAAGTGPAHALRPAVVHKSVNCRC